jgi:hypothetical protein
LEKIQKWIILPDMQVPYEDKRSLAAVEKYMAAHVWDGYLNLGDFLDFNELSHYVKGRPGAVKEDVAETFKAGREIIERHARIMRKNNGDSRMVLLQGNHDYRAVSYAEENPGLKGQLDVPTNLGLVELDVEWVKSWEDGKLFKLGNAYFLHGNYINKYHAFKMVDSYGSSVYYGHTHDLMSASKMTKTHGEVFEAASLGCLCRYDQAYMQGRPHNWQQAVTTLFVRPNGNYNIYSSRIFNHQFTAPDGVTYGG